MRCRPAASMEKFVLISKGTLPIKPFLTVYKELLLDDKSYMCSYPESAWTAWLFQNKTKRVAKVNQLVVLNRHHAELFLADYLPGHLSLLRWKSMGQGEFAVLERPDTAHFEHLFGGLAGQSPLPQVPSGKRGTKTCFEGNSSCVALQQSPPR